MGIQLKNNWLGGAIKAVLDKRKYDKSASEADFAMPWIPKDPSKPWPFGEPIHPVQNRFSDAVRNRVMDVASMTMAGTGGKNPLKTWIPKATMTKNELARRMIEERMEPKVPFDDELVASIADSIKSTVGFKPLYGELKSQIGYFLGGSRQNLTHINRADLREFLKEMYSLDDYSIEDIVKSAIKYIK